MNGGNPGVILRPFFQQKLHGLWVLPTLTWSQVMSGGHLLLPALQVKSKSLKQLFPPTTQPLAIDPFAPQEPFLAAVLEGWTSSDHFWEFGTSRKELPTFHWTKCHVKIRVSIQSILTGVIRQLLYPSRCSRVE